MTFEEFVEHFNLKTRQYYGLNNHLLVNEKGNVVNVDFKILPNKNMQMIVKEYEPVELESDCTIDSVVEILQSYNKQNKLVCVQFNESMLYSDIDTIDLVYKKLTGFDKDTYVNKLKNNTPLQNIDYHSKIPEVLKNL